MTFMYKGVPVKYFNTEEGVDFPILHMNSTDGLGETWTELTGKNHKIFADLLNGRH